ncbi:MAG TPA: outer membrane protein assembly factor BamA, partial [Longimicrobiales bacterium]|nr:outer membrane protein assembly factor BamA [Longimicrobiales bacterium]
MKLRNSWAPRACFAGALAMCLPIFVSAASAQQIDVGRGGVLDTVYVTGTVRQIPAIVVAQAGLVPGDSIDYRDLNEAIRRLMASGFYDDVKIYSRFANDANQGNVILRMDIVERPFVTDIQFEGLDYIRSSTVRDSAKLVVRSPMVPSRVATAENLIRDMLRQRGFMVRSVSHRLEPESQPGEYRLVFDVDAGQRVAVAEIEFRGNQAFSADDLWDAMGTKPEGFLWFRSGLYDEEKVRTDLRERLPDFYASAGYLDFTVVGDSLVVDPVSGKAKLIIEIDEGPQYRLGNFAVVGNRRFPESDLRQYFDQNRGGLLAGLGIGGRSRSEGFDRSAFDDATARISQLYRNQGYLYARVNPVVERTTLEDGTPAVNVTWQIEEGPPAYVNRVSIVGNTKTHEKVIRDRIFILPGDVYSEERLIQSYQSIMGLGFFESPLPLPRIEPNENGDVDITFEVTEKQTGSINFGTSIGGGGGLSGFLGYDEPNILGQAKSGSLRWEFGRWNNNFEASYSDPAIRGSRVSGSLSLFRARDRFVQFPEGQRRRTGASIRFGLPLPVSDFRTRLVVGYTLARTEYEQFS